MAFHQWRQPSRLAAPDVHAFLKHLAVDEQVAPSTQNQALNAVVFLYRKVVEKEIGDFSDVPRARMGLRLPVAASREEIKAVIERLSGREKLLGNLLYGTGMRLNELLGLRVLPPRPSAQAFLALPAIPGNVVDQGEADLKVRTSPSANGSSIGVAYKGYAGCSWIQRPASSQPRRPRYWVRWVPAN